MKNDFWPFKPFEPYELAKIGQYITFRITSPVPVECGVFTGIIIKHLNDNEFVVERPEHGTHYVVKQLSPHQFEGGRGSINLKG